MIDRINKNQNMGVGLVVGRQEYIEQMERNGHGKLKHNISDVIHLPKNVVDSDEEGVNDHSSEDENNKTVQEELHKRTETRRNEHELNSSFSKLTLIDKEKRMNEGIRKLRTILNDISPIEDLKARSPIKNVGYLNKHHQGPYCGRSNRATTLGSGGRVFVNNGQHDKHSIKMEDSQMQVIIKDFVSYFSKLSPAEQEQLFNEYTPPDQHNPQTITNHNTIPKEKNQVPEIHTLLPPDSHLTMSMLSPNNPIDLYDSSYETGSPSSSVAPSPGSPSFILSPTRNSVSSESDQELDPVVEVYPAKKIPNVPQKIIILPTGSNFNSLLPVKPLGEPIPCNRERATNRLYRLSTSTNFCIKHFSIQLVCVIMKTNADKASDRFNDFSKSLISLLEQTVGNKQNEIDNWQLAIYAHIQFLVAPERVNELGTALLGDGKGGLLFMAAIRHPDKPLIARYIAESMNQIGYDPNEVVDEEDNRLLHILANNGDSHCRVLAELVLATGHAGNRLFQLDVTNKEGRTPLHVAVRSPNPHITTTVFLLQEGANPLHQDMCNLTPLNYHIEQMRQMPRVSDDLALLKKMLNHAVPSSQEDSLILDFLQTDIKTPPDILPIIEKELRSKK